MDVFHIGLHFPVERSKEGNAIFKGKYFHFRWFQDRILNIYFILRHTHDSRQQITMNNR